MLDAFIKGFTISLLLIFSVGPVIFTTIKHSLNNGRYGGFSFIAGVWLSDVLWVFLSNMFSEAMTRLLSFQYQIGIAGSFFLIGLGLFYLFFKKLVLNDSAATLLVTARTHAKLFSSGFIINTLNPAVITFWLTTAAAISMSHNIQERVVLFSTCLFFNTAADVLKVLLAEKIRKKLSAKNILFFNRISGSILIGFGAVLLYGLVKGH